ncbi:MAG: hypothetical protein GC160_05775 [Acidobacteria bacterium]|nr:hypothetical protein [Acidobacteriota bacterium]
MVLTGVALEAPAGSVDLVIAVREADSAAPALLQGAYTLGAFLLPDDDPSALRSALISLQADGEGRLQDVEEVGHRRGERNAIRRGATGDYALTADGSFRVNLTGIAQAGGAHAWFASADGNYIVGAPNNGAKGLVVGVRKLSAAAPEGFVGFYRTGHIGFDGTFFHSGVGTATLRRGSDALTARRLRIADGAIDLSRRDFLTLSDDGAGWYSPAPYSGGANFALGVDDPIFTAGGGVGAGVDATGQLSEDLGAFLLLQPPFPAVSSGLFVVPTSIVHGASFSRPPTPLAPGLLSTIFGQGLIAPGGPESESASQAPLPTELAGVRVTVNGIAAPLIFVSAAQINFQVPTEAGPGMASIVVSNGQQQAEVRRRIAATSPGLFFSRTQNSEFAAIISRADGSLVTPASPARPGETVVFWSTGFGATQPAVRSGVPNPGLDGTTLARPVDPNISLLVGGLPATILFVGGTPGFVGLTQINATLPREAPLGDTVPVALVTSNAIQDQSDMPIAGAPLLTEEDDDRGSSSTPPTPSNQVRRTWRTP